MLDNMTQTLVLERKFALKALFKTGFKNYFNSWFLATKTGKGYPTL